MPQTSPILELQRQRMLLEIEYYTEKEAFRRQTEMIGLRRKVKRGDAWFPLRVGKSYYNSLNQLAVEIHRTADEEIEHNFEYGKPVCFFKAVSPQSSPKQEGKAVSLSYFSFTGTVSYVEDDRMVVTVPDGTRLADLQFSDGQLG